MFTRQKSKPLSSKTEKQFADFSYLKSKNSVRINRAYVACKFLHKGTWQWGGFSGVFAEIGSSWVPYTTFRAVPILASNSRRYSYSKKDSPLSTLRIVESRSRRLPASLIRGVGDSPHHWYWESAIEFFYKKTLCIDDTESCRLPAPVIWWVATPRIIESESRRLRVSLMRRDDDSVCHWVGESMTRSCYSKKKIV
jgi:hypothetical protein